jgi:methyl-accepting chemotaxis protein
MSIALNDVKIGKRLAAGFAGLLLVIVGMAAFAGWNQKTSDDRLGYVAESLVPSFNALSEVKFQLSEMRRFQLRALNAGPEQLPGDLQRIAAAQGRVETALAAYEKEIVDERDRALWVAEGAAIRKVMENWSRAEPAIHAGGERRAAALAEVLTSGLKDFEAAVVALEAHWKYNLELAAKAATENESAKDHAFLMLGLLLLGSLAGGIWFAIALTRSVTRPMAEATRAAEAVARGELNVAIAPSGNDEAAALLRTMESMRATLERFAQAQVDMAAAHDRGDIDARLDVQAYAGAYASMAKRVNDLVQSHIDVKFRFVDVVRRYGDGDFSADMPDLPGKKMQITQAARDVRASLQSVATQIKTLATAAARGDYTVRGDANAFRNEYREMVEGLNRLMQISETGLDEAVAVFGALAVGKLDRRVHGEFEGAYARLKADANATVDKLGETVQQIQLTADLVSSGSQELSRGNENLSQRTEEQASSLEETASSMEEMTSTVKHNADNAAQANQLAAAARGLAQKGGDVVGRAVSAMGEINQSSRRIAEIIGVIDEIAFQTNLLALNAAVEAARAGEQGRGFAVVASEVRNLASRSAEAAKQIKTLIEDSVRKVDDGSKLVDESGRTLEEIVGAVKKVSDLVAEISAASREQAAGVEEVNKAVTQMDEMTQQNAALVEEAAAATEALTEQARSLSELVAFFELGAGARRAPTVATISPASKAAPVRARTPRPVAVRATAPVRAPRAAAPPAVDSLAAAAQDGEWERF